MRPLLAAALLCLALAAPAPADELDSALDPVATACPTPHVWTTPGAQISRGFAIFHVQFWMVAPFVCDLFMYLPTDLEAPPLPTLARKPNVAQRPKPITAIDHDVMFVPLGWHDGDGFLRLRIGDAHAGRAQWYHAKIYYRLAP